MKLEITKCFVLKWNHNSLCITHLKLLDENGKYVKFLSPKESMKYLDWFTIEVKGMAPKAKKKREKGRKEKTGLEKELEEKRKRSLLFPQKEFPTL